MQRTFRLLPILVLATLLVACGAKGDLVKPTPVPAEAAPAVE